MESSAVKFFCVLGLMALLSAAAVTIVDAAGECQNSTPDREAMKLSPCWKATRDANAPVSSSCCERVRQSWSNPTCLCAILLSNTAKTFHVNPEIAITIPKRCNFADRLIGTKCGPYTLP